MTRRALAALALPAVLLTACTDNAASAVGSGAATSAGSSSGGAATVQVASSDTACTLSAAQAGAGTLVFDVRNDGSAVTEFYLYREDGRSIVGEMENIGPGLSRRLVVEAPAGRYVTACKPGMKGDGIRADFTVTGTGTQRAVSGDDRARVDAATATYARYVREQAASLLDGTKRFAALYTAGKDDEARALYPLARAPWERIEPVAESFGDLDPKMDAREADVPAGEAWTGWHVMEKDLWPPATGHTALTPAQRSAVAKQLVADTEELVRRTAGATFTVNQIANGSTSLLDEVATGKVTGEEEIWSHTDLYDVQANVDGARTGWQAVRPLLTAKDPALDARIAQRFTELDTLLATHRRGEGFVPYTQLTKDEVRRLSSAVDALSEPLSTVPAAVTL